MSEPPSRRRPASAGRPWRTLPPEARSARGARRRGLAALVLAHAHLDADGADPAVPVRAGVRARLALCRSAASSPSKVARVSSRQTPTLAEWLDRFRLFDVFTGALVRGDLPAAVPLADRLRRPAHRAPTCASCAASRPPRRATWPGCRSHAVVRRTPLTVEAGRRAGCARGASGSTTGPAGWPRRRATCARPATCSSTSPCSALLVAVGCGRPVRLPGQRAGRRGRRLRQHGRRLRPLHARAARCRAESLEPFSLHARGLPGDLPGRRASKSGQALDSRAMLKVNDSPGCARARLRRSRSTSRWRSTAPRPT